MITTLDQLFGQAISQTVCLLQEEMGLHSINNQCCHLILVIKVKHVMYYDPSVKNDTPEFYMYAALAGCALVLL